MTLVEPTTSDRLIHDPRTGDVIGPVPQADPAEVDAAVDAARAAASGWAATPAAERAAALHGAAAAVRAAADGSGGAVQRQNLADGRTEAIVDLPLGEFELQVALQDGAGNLLLKGTPMHVGVNRHER